MPNTVTIPLADATDAQLRQFATEHLGLDVHHLERGAPLRAKIQAAWDKPDITVREEAATPAGQRPTASAADPTAPAAEEPMVTIMIPQQEGADGSQPVWVSVNGRGLFIERGKPQTVKKRYVDALRNAVRTEYSQADAQAPIVARDVPSYPFSVIG
jgi:hypothetical protein